MSSPVGELDSEAIWPEDAGEGPRAGEVIRATRRPGPLRPEGARPEGGAMETFDDELPAPLRPRPPRDPWGEPRAEDPRAERRTGEGRRVEVGRAEGRRAENPRAENPRAESPRAESPRAENPRAESPRAEARRAEVERTDPDKPRFGTTRLAARGAGRRGDPIAEAPSAAPTSLRRRLGTLLALVLAGLAGGALSLALDRGLGRPAASPAGPVSGPADPAADPAAPPPLPTDPAAARALAVATLVAAEVPHGAIRHGRYPLRGAGRAPADTFDLVSFTCPLGTGCAPVFEALAARAAEAGLEMAAPRTDDRPGRPLLRALSAAGRPALAVRAFPPGPRLTLVLAGIGRAPAPTEALLALDPDLTFAVDAADPRAAAFAEALQAAGREVLVDLGGVAANDAPTVQQAVTRALAALPGAAGVVDAGAATRAANRTLVQALVEATRDGGRFFVDDAPAYRSVVQTAAVTAGARVVGPGALLDAAEPEAVTAQLKAVEAQLVLEGEALLVAVPTGAVLAALETWLPALRARGILVLRASEVAR